MNGYHLFTRTWSKWGGRCEGGDSKGTNKLRKTVQQGLVGMRHVIVNARAQVTLYCINVLIDIYDRWSYGLLQLLHYLGSGFARNRLVCKADRLLETRVEKCLDRLRGVLTSPRIFFRCTARSITRRPCCSRSCSANSAK